LESNVTVPIIGPPKPIEKTDPAGVGAGVGMGVGVGVGVGGTATALPPPEVPPPPPQLESTAATEADKSIFFNKLKFIASPIFLEVVRIPFDGND
jgi:hypothetical protein